MIIGTSTGGIITLALALGQPIPMIVNAFKKFKTGFLKSREKSVRRLVEKLFCTNFNCKCNEDIRKGVNLETEAEEEYKADAECNGKNHFLRDIDPKKIKVGIVAVMFLDTAKDTKGVLLSNCHEYSRNFNFIDVALATTAFDTLQKVRVPYNNGKDSVDLAFFDGSYVAQNPCMIAHAHAILQVRNPNTDIYHVSLTTGFLSPGETNENIDKANNIKSWACYGLDRCQNASYNMAMMTTSRIYSEVDSTLV